MSGNINKEQAGEEMEYVVDKCGVIRTALRSYSGFSLISELLQNANDAKLENDNELVDVEFDFMPNSLIVRNNKKFKETSRNTHEEKLRDDWWRITHILSGGKEIEHDKIGKFGWGFLSVYHITDNPEVASNSKAIVFDPTKNNVVPYNSNIKNTEFRFNYRFKKTDISEKIGRQPIDNDYIISLFNFTQNEMTNHILFLENISSVKIFKNSKLVSSLFRESKNGCIILGEKINSNDKGEWIAFEQDFSKDFSKEITGRIIENAKVKILFQKNLENRSEFEGRIYCGLPTENETNLPFHVNAHFIPDPGRKDIVLNRYDPDGKTNIKLLEKTADVLASNIDVIKTLFVNPKDFYEFLLISNLDRDYIQRIKESLHNSIIEFKSRIVWTNDGWRGFNDSFLLDRFGHYDDDYVGLRKLIKRLSINLVPPFGNNQDTIYELLDKFGLNKFGVNEFLKQYKKEFLNAINIKNSIFSKDEWLEELICVYKYIKRSRADPNKLIGINILLDKNLFFRKSDEVHIIDKEYEPVQELFNFRPVFLDEKYSNEFKDFYSFVSVDKIDVNSTIKILETKDIKEGTHIEQCPFPINNKKNIMTLLDLLIKKRSEIKKLPLLLDNGGCLYRVSNNKVFLISSAAERNFAKKFNIKNIDPDIYDLLKSYDIINRLSLDNVLKFLYEYIERGNKLEDSLLITIYQLLLDGKNELNNRSLVDAFMRIPIFKNNKRVFCPLIDHGKPMLIKGGYIDPIGIENILSEDLTSMVSGFKESILKNIFKIEILTFESFIRNYFQSIFDDQKVDQKKKLKLVSDLNEEFLRLEKSKSFNETLEILKNTKLIYCQDCKFYYSNNENMFFKSEKIDEVLDNDYLWPSFKDTEKFEHMLKALGVKTDLQPPHLVEYIERVSKQDLNNKTLQRLKNIFIHINDNWNDFLDKNQFDHLADIEWLPAIDIPHKLFRPPELYTKITREQSQNTEPFLKHLPDVKYLDIRDEDLKKKGKSSVIKFEVLNSFGLRNVAKIEINKIVKNIKIASQHSLDINADRIYLELNKRANEQEINELKQFPSIYIKYIEEEKPRFFYPKEVFKNDKHDKFGFEYIGYLNPKILANCENLLDALGVDKEPNSHTILDIFNKIDSKYKG